MSINKSVARRWVAKLRSGELRQGQGLLSYYSGDNTPRFCCLGVLCELAVEDGVIDPGEPQDVGAVAYDGMTGMPSVKILGYLGVYDWIVDVPADSLPRTLLHSGVHDGLVSVALDRLNDQANFTFEQIADAIERHYELADD